MSALTATLVNHHPGWPADMSAGPKPPRDPDPEQSSAGFTAVNGRPKDSSTESSPRQPDVFSPMTRERPLEHGYPRHERHESESSLKRKRSDRENISPSSSTSQRPYRQASPSLPTSASQPYPSPHTTHDAESAVGRSYGVSVDHPWSRQGEDTSLDQRLVEAIQSDRDHESDGKHSPGSTVDPSVSQSPYSPHMSVAPVPGQPIPVPLNVAPGQAYSQKQRKRNFTNRTKTGCLTCRERKKKCDEGKPTCTNCTRGGFICKGYPNTSNYLKTAISREHPTLQAKHEYRHITHPIGYAPAPSHFAPNPPHYPPQPYSEIYSRPMTAHRESTRPPTQESRQDYSRSHPPPPPPPPPAWQQPHDPYPHPPSTPHGPPPPHHYPPPPTHDMRPPPSMMPYENSRDLKRLPPPPQTSSDPLRASPYRDPESLASTASSALHGMNPKPLEEEYVRMVNHKPYNPWESDLCKRRARCAKSVNKYNTLVQSMTYPDDNNDVQVALRKVLEGDANKAILNLSPQNGLGQNVEVQAPFYCDYSINVNIGDDTVIGANCRIENACTVSIGRSCVVGSGCSFISSSPHDREEPKSPAPVPGRRRLFKGEPIKVQDNVIIGAHCLILQGVTIQEGAKIAPGSIVDRDITRGEVYGRRVQSHDRISSMG